MSSAAASQVGGSSSRTYSGLSVVYSADSGKPPDLALARKCHGFETDHGRQGRETAKNAQVTQDRHVTRGETLQLV